MGPGNTTPAEQLTRCRFGIAGQAKADFRPPNAREWEKEKRPTKPSEALSWAGRPAFVVDGRLLRKAKPNNVIPAKAGIQKRDRETGFPLARE